MLEFLHVKNLAVIDETEVAFGEGLNIITGETGAGKSVILGSVNLMLGARAERGLIRKGADSALIELEFTADGDLTKDLAKDDIYPEEDGFLFSRRIDESRNVCRINGEKNTLSAMKDVLSRFIAIHGQHENQVLLDAKKHLGLLDSYAKDEITPLLEEYRDCLSTYRALKKELDDDMDEEARAREISFLEFEVSQIEEAALKEGEDEELEESFRLMNSLEKVSEAFSEAVGILGDDGVSDMLGNVTALVSGLSGLDEDISKLVDEALQAEEIASNLRRSLKSYLDDHEYDAKELARIKERLDLINSLKHKYGRTIADIMSTYKEKCDRLKKLNDYEKNKERLLEEAQKAHRDLIEAGGKLTACRKAHAPLLSEKVEEAMRDLNFTRPVFSVRIEEKDEPSREGMDEVRFYVGLNPGDSPRPLEKTASGGELSRIMLAIRSVCALEDEAKTIIFDEIDSGISGNTAQAVAKKLYLLSTQLQVICITHLPQIASMADHHFVVEKSTDGSSTASSIRELDDDESVMEIAKMSGGASVTQTVIDSAAEMKKMAGEIKAKM